MNIIGKVFEIIGTNDSGMTPEDIGDVVNRAALVDHDSVTELRWGYAQGDFVPGTSHLVPEEPADNLIHDATPPTQPEVAAELSVPKHAGELVMFEEQRKLQVEAAQRSVEEQLKAA